MTCMAWTPLGLGHRLDLGDGHTNINETNKGIGSCVNTSSEMLMNDYLLVYLIVSCVCFFVGLGPLCGTQCLSLVYVCCWRSMDVWA